MKLLKWLPLSFVCPFLFGISVQATPYIGQKADILIESNADRDEPTFIEPCESAKSRAEDDLQKAISFYPDLKPSDVQVRLNYNKVEWREAFFCHQVSPENPNTHTPAEYACDPKYRFECRITLTSKSANFGFVEQTELDLKERFNDCEDHLTEIKTSTPVAYHRISRYYYGLLQNKQACKLNMVFLQKR